MRKGLYKTCFIAAPITANTSTLRQALERRQIRWVDTVSAPASWSLLDTIKSAIQASDFVCVLLPKSGEHANVLVELGLALGLGRPTLLFVEPEVEIPSEFQNLVYARARFQDRETLNFHLDAFLKHARKTSTAPSRGPAKRARKVDVSWAKSSLAAVSSRSGPSAALALEELIAKLLTQAGVVVARRPEASDRGVDMALWIDELQPTLQNPILVEAKYGRHVSRSDLSGAAGQLREYMAKTGASAGLLIFHSEGEEDTKIGWDRQWPLVLTISAKELIRFVGSGRLFSEIREQRNRAVHGVS